MPHPLSTDTEAPFNELLVNTNRKERKEDPTITGFLFRAGDGVFSITERWRGLDELYSDGVCIVVPPRILAEAWPWLIKNVKVKSP